LQPLQQVVAVAQVMLLMEQQKMVLPVVQVAVADFNLEMADLAIAVGIPLRKVTMEVQGLEVLEFMVAVVAVALVP
jgi:hypothetical protein